MAKNSRIKRLIIRVTTDLESEWEDGFRLKKPREQGTQGHGCEHLDE